MDATPWCRGHEGCLPPLQHLWRDEAATTSLEYALMLALVGLSAVAGYQSLGDTIAHGAQTGQEGVDSVGSMSAGGDAVGAVGGGSAGGMGAAGSGTAASPATGAAAPGR